MRQRCSESLALAALLAAVATTAIAAPPIFDDRGGPARVCGTDETGAKVAAPDPDVIEKWIRDNRIAAGGIVPVNFHVIYGSSGEGNVPEAWLDTQIRVLNSTFAGRGYNNSSVQTGHNTGYTFFKNSVTRTRSQAWFAMTPGSSAEREAKRALNVNPRGSLNVYTCRPVQGQLGWSTFPWALAGNPTFDGVVLLYATLPGGWAPRYNLGGTLTHEVGHWVGLYHTFQSGCYSDASCRTVGDLVCDTPAQGTSTSGCPSSKNTCSISAGNDPIHNYMDYSTDICYMQFTAGQDARADYMMATYRPLIGAAPAKQPTAVPGPEPLSRTTLQVSPNPFNPTTTLEFTLARNGHVSLRVYDVAGREVATLLDGEDVAGPHRAVFSGNGLSSGVYMAVLRTPDAVVSQRLVLVR